MRGPIVQSVVRTRSQSKMIETVESLIAFCRQNNRVCPQPTRWQDLYELLPSKKRLGGGWEPALPLILAAWHDTPALHKMLRLAEHIEWADKHGCLDAVATYLRNLQEEDWHHLGE